MERSSKEETNDEKENVEAAVREKKQDEQGDKDAQEFDVSTPCWFYMDSNGLKQGPFSFKEMFLWWKGGYFPSELLVRTVWEEKFEQLGNLPEFYSAPVRLIERIEKEQEDQVKQGNIEVPMVPTYYEPNKDEEHQPPLKNPKFQEYAVKGTFNSLTGKFQSGEGFFEGKGLPVDRDARMMAHYFDFSQYQQQMQAAEKKKKKPVKGTKKFWKERKEKKRRAKLVAEYLAD